MLDYEFSANLFQTKKTKSIPVIVLLKVKRKKREGDILLSFPFYDFHIRIEDVSGYYVERLERHQIYDRSLCMRARAHEENDYRRICEVCYPRAKGALRRRLLTKIQDKIIRGRLNNYDIERYVIAKILEKK